MKNWNNGVETPDSVQGPASWLTLAEHPPEGLMLESPTLGGALILVLTSGVPGGMLLPSESQYPYLCGELCIGHSDHCSYIYHRKETQEVLFNVESRAQLRPLQSCSDDSLAMGRLGWQGGGRGLTVTRVTDTSVCLPSARCLLKCFTGSSTFNCHTSPTR